ncbi:MAG: response regulator [Saprospiraceae bacterium]|nr:response regulator [Saprospiraceae bacterium]
MAVRILVVDDERDVARLVSQRFRKQITNNEFDFVFALGGAEALEILKQDQSIDMVLSDINMPEMNGFAFLEKMNEIAPTLKVIMVSAYGDMKNIREAMNHGAFDFITKPIDFEDLEKTIRKTLKEIELLRHAKIADELAEKNKQLHELDEMKSRFFTNIAHEFRTPLTIIGGMANQMREHPEQWQDKGLKMIIRNSNSLLNLVNQILDLRKLESGNLQLKMVQGDVMQYLSYIFESFQSLAESKDLQLHFLNAQQELWMDYDPDKFLRIISNLLSNAIKYTPEGGNVYLQVDQINTGQEAQLQIRVKDTGIGIPTDQLQQIFDRFYQVDDSTTRRGEGTGIGLALTRELVKLLNGDIRVESMPGKGSTFSITLPIRRDAPLEAMTQTETMHFVPQSPEQVDVISHLEASEKELPSLLIVEDNPDIVQYLKSCLEGLYHLDIASDGQAGIDKAIEQVPDIIISDVMMPVKDGFELCETLKNDERTSHIPIILLTAKADDESRIKGLKRGADAYLAKPFNKQELIVWLEKLLELRQRLQERYNALEENALLKDVATQQEDEFIQKVRQAVEKNIDDEDFGILQLCRAVNLSRAQLHNKIKALTGKSTSHYIRAIRLRKAKDLLKNPNLNISQVAYEVGFHDPKYFSKTFAEEFGILPGEMRKN